MRSASTETGSRGGVEADRVVPDVVAVKRSDPVYNAHGYLTKVPVSAITPFLEAFTSPGDVVCDPFAGSGMTGVAAAMSDRRVELRDISVLGRHIGSGYLNLVDPQELRAAALRVADAVLDRFPGVYEHSCSRCDRAATLSRTVWSVCFRCSSCEGSVNFYEALGAAGWSKADMRCPHCAEPFSTRTATRLGEAAVLDTVKCTCSAHLLDQSPSPPLGHLDPSAVSPPSAAILADRQMYHASALGKHGLSETSDFFSTRNLTILAALHEEIADEGDADIADKLMFAFTAVLPRASKRYQWSKKRPLNASNATYYIAPVFYEWNVLDLFLRKVRAVAKSDGQIRAARDKIKVPGPISANYVIGSADELDLADGSVDYVFTDPPFGSNLFYSDMSLFQEAWLGQFTEHEREAVVDRKASVAGRDFGHYEALLTGALKEIHRVLKPSGWLSLNFSNAKGELWALLQRAIDEASFVVVPERISLLDKGQRSVKGLASGFENVVTADLILSMRKALPGEVQPVTLPAADAVSGSVGDALKGGAPTPTHVYLQVIRSFLRNRWDTSELDISTIGDELRQRGFDVDPATGRLVHAGTPSTLR